MCARTQNNKNVKIRSVSLKVPEGAKTLNPELPIIRVLPTGEVYIINLLALFSSPVSSSPPSKRRIINLVIRPLLGGMGYTGPYVFLLKNDP